MKWWETTQEALRGLVANSKIATEILNSDLQNSPWKANYEKKKKKKSKLCIDLVALSRNSYNNFIVSNITEYHKEVYPIERQWEV